MADDACHTTSAEEEVAIAERALREGDLAHAAHHLANALAAEPTREDWLVMVDAIAAASGDPLSLFRVEKDGSTYYGKVALRARELYKRGEVVEAMSLLCDVLRAVPRAGYGAWLATWLERSAAKLDDAPADEVAKRVLGLLHGLASPAGTLPTDDIGEAFRRTTAQVSAGLAALREAHPRAALVHYAGAVALRRLGRPAEAVPLAQKAYELEPTYVTAVGLGSTRRDAGDIDGAIAAFEKALEHAPDEAAVMLDLGDLELDRMDASSAALWYTEALEREPGQPWALASLDYARAVRGDASARLRLSLLATTNPNDQRANHLAAMAAPYERWLPSPSDATLSTFGQIPWAKAGGRVQVGVSSLESPSVRTAFGLLAAQHGLSSVLDVAVAEIQKPDPRLPRRGSRWVAWTYDGILPKPAFDPPSQYARAALNEVVRSPYDLAAWADAVQPLARKIGSRGAAQLVGAMLHPPPLPQGEPAGRWIFRAQVAAALGLAQLDEGWTGSVGRDALIGLALGPMDWITAAAIVALGRVALCVPEACADAHEVFAILDEMPRPGHCPYEHALTCVWPWIPGLDDARAADLEARRAALEGWT